MIFFHRYRRDDHWFAGTFYRCISKAVSSLSRETLDIIRRRFLLNQKVSHSFAFFKRLFPISETFATQIQNIGNEWPNSRPMNKTSFRSSRDKNRGCNNIFQNYLPMRRKMFLRPRIGCDINVSVEYIFNLFHADDVVIIGETLEEIGQMLIDLNESSR